MLISMTISLGLTLPRVTKFTSTLSAKNFEGYTKKQVHQAEHARCLMGMVTSPYECNFQAMVCLDMLKDRPVTNDDICNAHDIYGPDLASIRGKMVRQKP
jgi:hypothetical protein